MPLVTPSETVAVLERHGLHLSSELGQNFLVDANVLKKIIAAAELAPGDVVVEVGAGIGTLTEALAAGGATVYSLELDRRLGGVLRETVGLAENVHIRLADALRFDLGSLPEMPRKLVSNLPYNIAGPLLAEWPRRYPEIELYVVMVQKEMADRLLAPPGGKQYAALSLKVQLFCRGKRVAEVPRTVFIPRPHVDSAILRLERMPPPIPAEEVGAFLSLVDGVFAQRRKMLRATLPKYLGQPKEAVEPGLTRAGLTGAERPEALSLEQFLRLYEEVKALAV